MPRRKDDPRAAKVQYWRIFKIDELIRSGHCPDSARLARELEVNPRTIKRDIEYLRLYFGAPVEYDAARKGYRYTEPGFHLPAVSLTGEELSLLSLAPLFFEQWKRTPLYGRAKKVFDKVTRAVPGAVSVNPAWLQSGFSARPESGTAVSQPVWDAVFTALHDKKPLEAVYRSPRGESRKRTIEPYHALCHQGEWYLVANTPEGIRTFALSRMNRPRVAAGTVKVPAGFDIREYMSHSFGVFRGDKLRTVRIAFSPDLAPYVRERAWHATQKTRDRKDGGLEISFTVDHLFEVKRWVLSWGRGATVLAPKEFVREMAEETGAMRGNYRQRRKRTTDDTDKS
ncbi:MAG: WYL domain-containing transcriptional regulator [Spirochaetales bacterium]|nr:WYL domain-containing transcriptional regulator [Spirochaetales bacterium]